MQVLRSLLEFRVEATCWSLRWVAKRRLSRCALPEPEFSAAATEAEAFGCRVGVRRKAEWTPLIALAVDNSAFGRASKGVVRCC